MGTHSKVLLRMERSSATYRNCRWPQGDMLSISGRWECRRCGAVGHLDIQCRVVTRAMIAKTEAEFATAVMASRTKAQAVRVLRANAGISRTPPVLQTRWPIRPRRRSGDARRDGAKRPRLKDCAAGQAINRRLEEEESTTAADRPRGFA